MLVHVSRHAARVLKGAQCGLRGRHATLQELSILDEDVLGALATAEAGAADASKGCDAGRHAVVCHKAATRAKWGVHSAGLL